MIKKIKENIFQIYFNKFGSCVYFIKLDKNNILIDTSSKENSYELISDLEQLDIKPNDINIIILTHNHFDHIGNYELFAKAKIYMSIDDFGKEFNNINRLSLADLKIIHTPGHSKGSICILYKDILFSGDTLFYNGMIGRTDLQGGSEKEIQKSLEKLKQINFKILCPGHI